MSLSPEHISTCEEVLNRIATELVLAKPGSDDGLVPIYALVNELGGVVESLDASLHAACMDARRALDELLDESQPFDDRTLGYINSFATWAQAALLKLKAGAQPDAFAPAGWMNDDEEHESHAGLSLDAAERLVNQIATEQILASAGSDEGLVPIYSLTSEFADAAGQVDLEDAAAKLKAALDQLLDNAKPFDSETLEYVGRFTTWAQGAIQQLGQGSVLLDPFPAMEGLDVVEGVADTSPPELSWEESVAIAASEAQADEQAELRATIAQETDVLLSLGDEDRELLGEFRTEALEHLENIEAAVLTLEHKPKDSDSLASVFRAFHTIKGVAGFLHLVPIQSLAHEVETLLDYARNHKLVLNSEMITLILQAKDTLQALTQQIAVALDAGNQPTEIIPVSHLIVSVQVAAREGLEAASGKVVVKKAAPPPPAKANGAVSTPAAPQPPATSTAVTQAATAVEAPSSGSGSSAASTISDNGANSTIRVKTGKLDNLMDMVGELVIVQAQLAESAAQVGGRGDSALQRNVTQLLRITRELQHNSMSLRLVPIKPTFQKVGRLVRDLAGTFQKKVSFITEGEDTELDRNVVEQINDPLVHMIRNSLDHGLEATAEERRAAGKSEAGRIVLKAYHQGSNIVIELSDDGRGIDPDRVLRKARERGLVREDQQLVRGDILALIFEPGFSTAEKVSDVSGRGVGMDVVRRNIEKLRGKVELDSQLGVGTTFKIKLPLTTAIIDGLIVRVGEDRFILPTTSVKVALRPEKQQISKIKGKAEVLDLRGKTIPLVRLHERFQIETEIHKPWEGIVVIVETFGRPYGLLVDDMVSKQEVVIKSLGNMMKGIPGVAGGAILGDGGIALILDPAGLVGIH